MSEEMWHASVLTLASALVAGLCWLIAKASTWFTTHSKNQQVALLLARVSDLAQRVVKDVYQSSVAPFQTDNNWNAETQAVAKAQALAKLKSYIGIDGLHMLEYLAGMGGTQTLDEFLGTYIESAVVDSKTAAAKQVVVSTGSAPAGVPAAATSTSAPPPAAKPVNPT